MGLVRSLAAQFASYGITVNNVGPGLTSTKRGLDVIQKRATTDGTTVKEAEQELMRDVPTGRMVTPEEVPATIVWLASESAASTTGQTILVDGGAYRGL